MSFNPLTTWGWGKFGPQCHNFPSCQQLHFHGLWNNHKLQDLVWRNFSIVCECEKNFLFINLSPGPGPARQWNPVIVFLFTRRWWQQLTGECVALFYWVTVGPTRGASEHIVWSSRTTNLSHTQCGDLDNIVLYQHLHRLCFSQGVL